MIIGLVIAAILVFLSPLCAEVSPYLLAANRFLIGASFGTSPATYQVLLASWAPKNELGFMSTFGYSGLSIGGLLGLVVPGWMSEQFGWRSIFYLGGAMTCLVPPLWFFLVRNKPSDHPMLSDYERRLLAENIKIKT
ncbi:putative small intestine urate exporter, partial [Armadillidium nasatum]